LITMIAAAHIRPAPRAAVIFRGNAAGRKWAADGESSRIFDRFGHLRIDRPASAL
jgi:hypothetical protein